MRESRWRLQAQEDKAADVAVDQLGEDVAFLKNSQVARHKVRVPAGAFFAARRASRAHARIATSLLPTLAVPPAPPRTEAPCTPPPAADLGKSGTAQAKGRQRRPRQNRDMVAAERWGGFGRPFRFDRWDQAPRQLRIAKRCSAYETLPSAARGRN